MITFELKEAVKEMRVMGFSQGQILRMVDTVGIDFINDEGNCFISASGYDEWVDANRDKVSQGRVEKHTLPNGEVVYGM